MSGKIDVRQRIAKSFDRREAIERALVTLDKGNLWQGDSERAKYLASWVKNGKQLTGRFIDEARQIVLAHVEQLIRPSLEKSQEAIAQLEKRLAHLREWVQACEEELKSPPPDEDACPHCKRTTCGYMDGKDCPLQAAAPLITAAKMADQEGQEAWENAVF